MEAVAVDAERPGPNSHTNVNKPRIYFTSSDSVRATEMQ